MLATIQRGFSINDSIYHKGVTQNGWRSIPSIEHEVGRTNQVTEWAVSGMTQTNGVPGMQDSLKGREIEPITVEL